MASMYDEDEDIPDAVLAKLVPRKANKWILAAIASEFVEGVFELSAEAMHSVTTILYQRFNYHQDRQEMFDTVGRDIERIDQLMGAEGASTD